MLYSFKNKVSGSWRMVNAQIFMEYARKWRKTMIMLLVGEKVLSQDEWVGLNKNYQHHHQVGL